MLLLAAVLVAGVSNLDNLAAGFAFGIRGTRIATTPNLIIAAITMAGTVVAISSGHALSGVLAPGVAPALGASIIIVIGAWTILGSFAGEASLVSVPAMHGEMTPANAVGLGVALALNNVGTGIGAGVAGLSPVATTLLAGVISLLFVGGGSKAGRVFGQLVRVGPAQRMSGLILLGLGTAMLAGLG